MNESSGKRGKVGITADPSMFPKQGVTVHTLMCVSCKVIHKYLLFFSNNISTLSKLLKEKQG